MEETGYPEKLEQPIGQVGVGGGGLFPIEMRTDVKPFTGSVARLSLLLVLV